MTTPDHPAGRDPDIPCGGSEHASDIAAKKAGIVPLRQALGALASALISRADKTEGRKQERADNDCDFQVRFWGARGSIPVSGAEFQQYGGATACVEVQCGGHTLLFDAGTGIRTAGVSLLSAGVKNIQLFFTHFHYDHVLGLPFFAPLYDPSTQLGLWSGHMAGRMSTRQMLNELMCPPWFPIESKLCRAELVTRDFNSGDVLTPWPDVKIRTASLNHPGGCIGYRIEFEGRIVALVTDTEHVDGALDPNVLALIENADLVIYDSAYTDEEMASRHGFGHSSWQQGVRLCQAANASRLALFHHDPFRTDEALAKIEAAAQQAFPGAFAARDNQLVRINMTEKAAAR